MTVTFFPEFTTAVDTRVFRLECTRDGTAKPVHLGDYVGGANAYGEAQAHGLVCDWFDCQAYGANCEETFAPGAPVPVNMNNRNAADVLRVLGLCGPLDGEQAGDYDARAFTDLVNAALAVGVTDRGLDTIDVARGSGDDSGRYIDCGRAPGYLVGRLRELRDLAEACAKLGVRVVWA